MLSALGRRAAIRSETGGAGPRAGRGRGQGGSEAGHAQCAGPRSGDPERNGRGRGRGRGGAWSGRERGWAEPESLRLDGSPAGAGPGAGPARGGAARGRMLSARSCSLGPVPQPENRIGGGGGIGRGGSSESGGRGERNYEGISDKPPIAWGRRRLAGRKTRQAAAGRAEEDPPQ